MTTDNGNSPTRVVVGIDGSAPADAALAWAVAEAHLWRVPLLVAHTWELAPLVASAPFAASAIAAGALEDDAHATADMAVSRARSLDPGVAMTAVVKGGRAAAALLDLTDPGDLLVVGRRGRGAVESLLLGSVSQHCVEHAAVPVAVVPSIKQVVARGHRFVVVGVDASPGSDRALTWAAAEASRRGIAVRALHTWSQPTLVTASGRLATLPERGRYEEAEVVVHRAEDVLRAAVADVPIERRLACGDPATALLNASHDADLVVVGSRGRGAFAGLVLGSVSQECARTAHCPVVVVPEGR